MKDLKKQQKEEMKREALKLYKDGLSYQDIATELGIGKTTVYNWITYDYPKYDVRSVHGTNSEQKNGILNENGELAELDELKKDLQDEYGTNKDIIVLVELRKSELEHNLELEKLEMEREDKIRNQEIEEKKLKTDHLKEKLDKTEISLANVQQKSEQLISENTELGSVIDDMRINNKEMRDLIEEITAEEEIIELSEELVDEFTDRIGEFLALEDNRSNIESIEEIAEDTQATIKIIGKWYKKQNIEKSTSKERSVLKNVMASLDEILLEFDKTGEEELEITFDSDFELDLKAEYS